MFGPKKLVFVITCLLFVQSISCANNERSDSVSDIQDKSSDTTKSSIPCCYRSVLSKINHDIFENVSAIQDNIFDGIRIDLSDQNIQIFKKDGNLVVLKTQAEESITDWYDIVNWDSLKLYGINNRGTAYVGSPLIRYNQKYRNTFFQFL